MKTFCNIVACLALLAGAIILIISNDKISAIQLDVLAIYFKLLASDFSKQE